ncbi:hypothetical protein FI667_g8957, partial [Globisporangium splendens]
MAVLVFTTDNKYVCPQEGCSIAYDKLNSLRQHCKRHHGATVTLRAQKTCIEEKRRRQREYTARYREKKNAARRPVKKHYSYTGVDDANEHGVFGCRSPLLAYRQSNIEGAGNGVFALQDFQPGDIVTWYSGEKTASIPDDPSYAIDVRSGFLDGIRSPKQGEGLASFVNREERTKPKCRKNCTIIKCPGEKHSLYLEPRTRDQAHASIFHVLAHSVPMLFKQSWRNSGQNCLLAHRRSVGITTRKDGANMEMPGKRIALVLRRGGGTWYSAGLNAANGVLSRNDFKTYRPIVVFFSGGQPEDQGPGEQLTISLRQSCGESGREAFAVGFGSINLQVLQRVAKMLGGTYHHALTCTQ